MKIPNPKNYEYLWSNHDLNLFFLSYWLNEEYKKRNLIIIFDSRTKEGKYFLSKRTINYLSKFGFLFFKKLFPKWQEKIEQRIKEARKVIREVEKKDLSWFSNSELKKDFISKIKFYQSLGSLYFYTEFFLTNEVEKKIEEDPKKHKILFLNVREMQKIKFKAREIINKFWFKEGIFKKYIDEIKKRTKRDDLYWLHYKEIAKILEGRKIKSSDRNKQDWVFAKFNDWKIIVGEKATKILNKFDRHFFEREIEEIRGKIANSGFYTGKVRVIKTIFGKEVKKEIEKMKEGNILVVSSTGPEIMLACQKAGAIITDEGGITSHAAIVSRELGIPCIIGTKIATKILKDGDVVEVDANAGIVKILKRAK